MAVDAHARPKWRSLKCYWSHIDGRNNDKGGKETFISGLMSSLQYLATLSPSARFSSIMQP